MKIAWSWRIALLYGAFVIMMVGLVAASSHQTVELVSKDYYKDEINYQTVLDASKNQAKLNGTFTIHADGNAVFIDFPPEFDKKSLMGSVMFYSDVTENWDKSFAINTNGNEMIIPRKDLQRTVYQIKITYAAGGQNFYYQTRLDLHAS